MICIIIFPEYSYNSSLEGLNLWFNIVCPALLPFFICIEILIGLGVVSFLGAVFAPLMGFLFNVPGEGAFAFIMSIASGYPIGANTVATLLKENACSKTEAQRMLSLCSTSGPLFIIGAVSIGIFKNPEIGLILVVSHYLSAISSGLIMRFYKIKEQSDKKNSFTNPFKELSKHRKKDNRPIGKIIADSIKNAVNLILIVGGYIVFFSVISKILMVTGILSIIPESINRFLNAEIVSIDNWSALTVGILEVTNGIKECAKLDIPFITKIVYTSFFIGFGGFSVNAQVSGVIQNTDLNFPLYLLIKLFQGIAAALYSLLLLKLNLPKYTFNYFIRKHPYSIISLGEIAVLSLYSLIKIFTVLTLLSTFIICFKKIRNIMT